MKKKKEKKQNRFTYLISTWNLDKAPLLSASHLICLQADLMHNRPTNHHNENAKLILSLWGRERESLAHRAPAGSPAELVWLSIHLTCAPARRVFPLNYLQPGFSDGSRQRDKQRESERDKWRSAPPRVLLLLVCLHWQAVDTDLPYQPRRLLISSWWMGHAHTRLPVCWRPSRSRDLAPLYSYIQSRAMWSDTWTRLDRFLKYLHARFKNTIPRALGDVHKCSRMWKKKQDFLLQQGGEICQN